MQPFTSSSADANSWEGRKVYFNRSGVMLSPRITAIAEVW